MFRSDFNESFQIDSFNFIAHYGGLTLGHPKNDLHMALSEPNTVNTLTLFWWWTEKREKQYLQN